MTQHLARAGLDHLKAGYSGQTDAMLALIEKARDSAQHGGKQAVIDTLDDLAGMIGNARQTVEAIHQVATVAQPAPAPDIQSAEERAARRSRPTRTSLPEGE